MNFRTAVGGILILFLVGCAPSKIYYLKGDWEVSTKPASKRDSANPNSDAKGEFETMSFPLRFEGQQVGFQATARYKLDPGIIRNIRETKNLAFFSGAASDQCTFYLNEQLIGQNYNPINKSSGHNKHVIAPIPKEAWSENAVDYLVVHFSSQTEISSFLTDRKISIGPLNEIYSEYRREETITLCLISLFLAVGFYHLLLFIRRPKESHNFYFGIFCLFVSAGFFMRSYTAADIFGDHTLLRSRVRFISFYLMGTPLLFFLSKYLVNRYSRIGFVLGPFHGILILLTAFGNYHILEICRALWTASSLPTMLYMVAFTTRLAFKGNVDARYISLGFGIFMLSAAFDALASIGIWNLPDLLLSRYTFVLLILGIAGLLASRFVRLHNEVEDLNKDLESKVIQRTNQLQETLKQVEELKIQQDGDYFLTSMLMKPLNGSDVDSKTVDIQILMKQKKSFSFRKWQAEIGGDLCAVHTIELRGRKYVAFLNGDAMGKSMQGAGGALVLGGVFKSIITRSINTQPSQSKYPERWLRDCFLDLQEVFVSFDGYMLISAIIGLIDEETGVLYFINAEHPNLVLYRENHAEFLHHRSMLRKIGFFTGEQILVDVFQARPNDIFFIGSDGRDDIEIGVDQTGQRIINEDEDLFLRKVEEGNGDIKSIFASIQSTGSLIDDFTLIRIAFLEDASLVLSDKDIRNQKKYKLALSFLQNEDWVEAKQILSEIVEEDPRNAHALHGLGKLLMKEKLFSEAASFLLQASDLNPMDENLLYETSYALKFARNIELSIDFGERLRLRNPTLNRNLINLADAYRIHGNIKRAKLILEEIREPIDEGSSYRRLTELLSV